MLVQRIWSGQPNKTAVVDALHYFSSFLTSTYRWVNMKGIIKKKVYNLSIIKSVQLLIKSISVYTEFIFISLAISVIALFPINYLQ